MNIGQAASQSGLPAKTLRYYEDIGLVLPQRCAGNDYRDYSSDDVAHLRFLQRARAAGFSVDVCRELLAVFRKSENSTADVKNDLSEKIQQVENQLQELTAFKNTLSEMLNNISNVDSDKVSSDAVEVEKTTPARSARMSFTLMNDVD